MEKPAAAMCAVSMSTVLGDGTTALLLIDSWASFGPLCKVTPALYAAISRSGKKRTMKDGLSQNRWARHIVGALTTQVLCQFLQVWQHLCDVDLNPFQVDHFVWKWSSNGKYSASSTYYVFFNGLMSLLGAKDLWRTRAPPKVKFFFWLALHRRLWMAECHKRHGLQDSDECIMCG